MKKNTLALLVPQSALWWNHQWNRKPGLLLGGLPRNLLLVLSWFVLIPWDFIYTVNQMELGINLGIMELGFLGWMRGRPVEGWNSKLRYSQGMVIWSQCSAARGVRGSTFGEEMTVAIGSFDSWKLVPLKKSCWVPKVLLDLNHNYSSPVTFLHCGGFHAVLHGNYVVAGQL